MEIESRQGFEQNNIVLQKLTLRYAMCSKLSPAVVGEVTQLQKGIVNRCHVNFVDVEGIKIDGAFLSTLLGMRSLQP